MEKISKGCLVPVKAVNPKRHLNLILQQLDEVRERREELYAKYLKAKNEKSRQKVREQLHPLDQLLEKYFLQAWNAYRKLDSWYADREFGFDELEQIDVYKGFDKKQRIVYCDGELHFVLTDSKKTGKVKYKYGYFCNC